MLRRVGRCELDGDGTSHSTNRARSRAEEVLEQILASKDGRSFIKMSQNTYSEPVSYTHLTLPTNSLV